MSRKVFKSGFQGMGMTEEETAKKGTKKSAKPSWVKMKPAELEKIIVELAKKGESLAKIGLILRDRHGLPKAKLLGKRIAQILKENGVKYESDKDVVDGKVSKLKSHLEKNKHDHSASRALTRKLWDLYHISKKA
jgi:small subunit ribosomal protein S15